MCGSGCIWDHCTFITYAPCMWYVSYICSGTCCFLLCQCQVNLKWTCMDLYYHISTIHTAIQYLCWLTWLMSCLTHRCFRRCFLESSFWTASNMDFLYYPLWIYNPEMNMTHEHGETVICHIQWAKCLPLVLWCVWKETGCALKSRRSSMVFTHENPHGTWKYTVGKETSANRQLLCSMLVFLGVD